MNKNLLIIVFFIITFNISRSQNVSEIKYTVIGKIQDSIDKKPLSYANIGIMKKKNTDFFRCFYYYFIA